MKRLNNFNVSTGLPTNAVWFRKIRVGCGVKMEKPARIANLRRHVWVWGNTGFSEADADTSVSPPAKRDYRVNIRGAPRLRYEGRNVSLRD